MLLPLSLSLPAAGVFSVSSAEFCKVKPTTSCSRVAQIKHDYTTIKVLSVLSHIVEDIDNESDNGDGDDDKGNSNDVMKMFFIHQFLTQTSLLLPPMLERR